MRAKITIRNVEMIRQEAMRKMADLFLWDTELRGFGAKATAKGSLSWLVQKWQGGRGGKAARIVIGHYPPIAPDDARNLAGINIGEALKGSPLVGRRERVRQAKRERSLSVRLEDAAQTYLKRNSKPGTYWREVEQYVTRDMIPRLGKDTPVASITRAELQSLIDDKQDKAPAAARNLYAHVRAFFSWCVERDMIAESPIGNMKAPPRVEARDRVLTEAEIKAFWRATGDPQLFDAHLYGPFYRLLLLTAQRLREVAGMSWPELDLAKGEWIIPKERTKNGKEHLVHLSPQALSILKAQPKLEGTELLFSTTLNTPISSFSRAKDSLDTLMPGLPEWRNHDLRRTAASGMAKLGFLPHVTERVLNHISGAQGGLVGVYQRYEYAEERKRAVLAWNAHIQALVDDTIQASNVVSLRG